MPHYAIRHFFWSTCMFKMCEFVFYVYVYIYFFFLFNSYVNVCAIVFMTFIIFCKKIMHGPIEKTAYAEWVFPTC